MITYRELVEQTLEEPENRNKSRLESFMRQYKEYQIFLKDRLCSLVSPSKENMLAILKIATPDLTKEVLDTSFQSQFSLRVNDLAPLCYRYLSMSCHEFVTGETPAVPLSKNLNLLANTLYKISHMYRIFGEPKQASLAENFALMRSFCKMLSQQILQEVRADLESRYSHYWKKNIDLSETSFVLSERYVEYCQERYIDYADFWKTRRTSGWNVTDKRYILPLLDPENREKSKIRIRVPVILYISILTGIPMDYFIIRNYAEYLPITFRMKNIYGTEMEKTLDGTLKDIVERMLYLPSEIRASYIAELLLKYPGVF